MNWDETDWREPSKSHPQKVTSTSDRDGVVTTYSYDAMKRPIATTRLGVTTISESSDATNGGLVVC